MNRLQRIVLGGVLVLAVLVLVLGSYQSALAEANPGWGGSQGNRGPHSP
jgi:hypothetical protein